MFVDVKLLGHDVIIGMMAQGKRDERIGRGQYRINHFNLDHLLPGRDKWETSSWIEIGGEEFHSYGVCDSPEQFMEKVGKALDESADEYVVGFTRMRKDEQSEDGGWRWHKWGEYIGTQSPQCEYLYDEPVIEEVYCYHFYKYKRV